MNVVVQRRHAKVSCFMVLKSFSLKGALNSISSWLPWTARRTNLSILNEISPEYLLEGLILKLKLQYFGHLMERTDSIEKTLMAGKD